MISPQNIFDNHVSSTKRLNDFVNLYSTKKYQKNKRNSINNKDYIIPTYNNTNNLLNNQSYLTDHFKKENDKNINSIVNIISDVKFKSFKNYKENIID